MQKDTHTTAGRSKLSKYDVKVHRDPSTLSNYDKFETTNTAVDLHIDFDKKRLTGTVTLTLQSLTYAEASEVVLDTSYLDIKDVKVGGKAVKWELSAKRQEPYGSPLTIKLEQGVAHHKQVQVEIVVSTTDKCTALQWLTPAQTSNRKHPYMFSQCQAIHARSLLPCMDTPDNKSTFEFRLRSLLPVVASGLPAGLETIDGSDEKVYVFKQKVPMPSYLFAIASGDIASAAVGPRSTVWTAPDMLEASKWELEEGTETFIKAAEAIVYDYAWGTYNMLVLPPSFPYGGMEK
jgi:leukotriene-A4 hydrolase